MRRGKFRMTFPVWAFWGAGPVVDRARVSPANWFALRIGTAGLRARASAHGAGDLLARN